MNASSLSGLSGLVSGGEFSMMTYLALATLSAISVEHVRLALLMILSVTL